METMPSPANAFAALELAVGESDAGLLARIKRIARSLADAGGLSIGGSYGSGIDDIVAFGEWVALLAALPVPVVAVVTDAIGPRGWAVLLAADQVVIGPGAQAQSDWRETPGLTALLHRRLGPLGARRLLFRDSGDPLAALVEAGLAVRTSDPAALVATMADRLGTPTQGRRRKRVLAAAAELPFAEAFAFDLWFDRPAAESHR
jgi:enoyl-CoA hydratase/carnithine racemase